MAGLSKLKILRVINRWIRDLSSFDPITQTKIFRGVLEKFPSLQQYALSLTLELNNPEEKLRVFLCHTSQDKVEVRKIYNHLKTVKWIDPWLDEEKIKPGQEWEFEIERAVDETHVVILCLSQKSVTKEGYVQKEIKRILDKADEKPPDIIFIIPLRLEECPVPKRFKKWHWIDYWNEDWYLKVIGSLSARGKNLDLFKMSRSKKDKLIAEGGRESDNIGKIEEVGQKDGLLISEAISEKETLAIQVKGDAMKDAGILNGDHLLLELCEFSEIKAGDLIVTRYLEPSFADKEFVEILPYDFTGPTLKYYTGTRKISNNIFYVLSNSKNKNSGYYIMTPALDVQGVVKFMVRSYREPAFTLND